MVLKTLESPLDSKEIQPVYPKGNPSWIFIEKTDAEGLKLLYFCHLIWRMDSLEKTLMLRKIEGGRRRGWQRMRLVRWHHQLNEHEFEQVPGVGDGQESLVYSVYGVAKSQTQLSYWTELIVSWFWTKPPKQLNNRKENVQQIVLQLENAPLPLLHNIKRVNSTCAKFKSQNIKLLEK